MLYSRKLHSRGSNTPSNSNEIKKCGMPNSGLTGFKSQFLKQYIHRMKLFLVTQRQVLCSSLKSTTLTLICNGLTTKNNSTQRQGHTYSDTKCSLIRKVYELLLPTLLVTIRGECFHGVLVLAGLSTTFFNLFQLSLDTCTQGSEEHKLKILLY